MICPYCGTRDDSVEVPQKASHVDDHLADCSACGEPVYATHDFDKVVRGSQAKAVSRGETSEAELADRYVERELPSGAHHEQATRDIDLKIFDENGALDHFLEIKTRNATLNAYAETVFRDLKVEEARTLAEEYGVPSHILIAFEDCVTIHHLDPDGEYDIGPFERWDRDGPKPHVFLPVEQLRVLDW
ncbi:hypothetical protein [Halobellus salinisoli]|uniref:hypothetical protein n=1 Tax=Halobellus salinisoli TaxID=3108500 RepID=UPI00300897A1